MSSLLMGVIKHSQSTQSNKFAISLQYLKKEVRNGGHFLHEDKHQVAISVFNGSNQKCPKYTKYEVGNIFAIYQEKILQLLLRSIVMQNIQIFFGGSVIFVVVCSLLGGCGQKWTWRFQS